MYFTKNKITVVFFFGLVLLTCFSFKTNVLKALTINLLDELIQEGVTDNPQLPTSSTYKFEETTYRPLEFNNQSILPTTQTLTSQSAPNIVFILTDDQPSYALGIAGDPIIRTPNIDALGRSGGMFFKNAYVATPLCAPSRSSLLTGKMSHSHGVLYNSLLLPSAQLTLPEVLKSNGYDTALIGKCHLGTPSGMGFDYQIETPAWPSWAYGASYPVIRNGRSELQTQYHTNFLTDEAIKYIGDKISTQSTTHKPFFLWLAYNAPHQLNNPPPTPNRYTVSQFGQPTSITDNLTTKPPQQSLQSPHQILNLTSVPITGTIGWPQVQAAKEAAWEEISIIDDSVGRIKQKLAELGISDNTIIVYLSDNGLFYGEHQLFQKASYFYEEQVKTPLIINYPRIISSPGIKNTYVSTIDLAPTLLSMVGLTPPSDMQGKSMLPFLRNQSTSHRTSAFFEFTSVDGSQEKYYPMRGLAMDGFKLVHHIITNDTKTGAITGATYTPDGKDYELYNLNTDPKEMVNLARRNGPTDSPLNRLRIDSNLGTQVRKMLREIARWQTDTRDPIARVISGARYTWINASTVRLEWTSPDALSTEVTYKERGCTSCVLQEKYDFNLTSAHAIEVNGISSIKNYDFTLYSISENGNGAYQNLSVNAGSPPASSPTPTAIPRSTATPPTNVADVNSDNSVDILDIGIIIDNYGRTPLPNPRADINYDNSADILDIGIIIDNYNR
jgi:arylsulfatase A-like enzyme